MKKNDLLFEKICSIQTEYKILLENIIDNISPDNISNAILDEIYIFWSTRLDIVDLYLQNLPSSQDVFAFTGATYLDLEELEHYSFMLLGDIHILDDQVYKYANIVAGKNDSEFIRRMRKQIINSIRSDHEILSKYGNYILILPFRSSDSEYRELIAKNIQYTFLDLFKTPPKSIEEYVAKYKTIDNICGGLRDDIANALILSDNDDISKPVRDRLDIALKDESLSAGINESMGFKFWMVVGSHLGQALDIIVSCCNYNIIPYLRYSVAFHYVLLLGQNFSEHKEIQPIFFKCCLARSLHGNLDIERFKEVDFYDYCNVVRESNFYQNLLSAFPVQSIENLSAKEINCVVRDKLDMLYSLFDDMPCDL